MRPGRGEPRRGRQLFQRKFTRLEGQGPRVNAGSTGDQVTNRALGAGLADSCAACHGRPRGSAGHGGVVNTRPDSRDAPHLFGLGLVEQLAEEMTADLRQIRQNAIDAAQNGSGTLIDEDFESGLGGFVYQDDTFGTNQPAYADGEPFFSSSQNDTVILVKLGNIDNATIQGMSGGFNNQKTLADEETSVFFNDVVVQGPSGGPVTLPLDTKGVSFGSITAFQDGSVDTSAVEGVDTDLRVKPFFHQGGTISMREFIVGALKAEMGLEVPDPVLCAATDPSNPQAATSPSGFVFDPSEDTFERPPVCDAFTDGDGDGVVNEIDPALLDHLEFYLLNYFKPGQGRTDGFTDSGLQLMQQIGCTSCHVRNLTIDSDRRVADVETVHDPVNGIFNEIFATASTRFTVVDDGQEFPKLLPEGNPFVVENFFSDLKRHDLGPKFHERDFDGNTVTHFVRRCTGASTWARSSRSPPKGPNRLPGRGPVPAPDPARPPGRAGSFHGLGASSGARL